MKVVTRDSKRVVTISFLLLFCCLFELTSYLKLLGNNSRQHRRVLITILIGVDCPL